MMAMCTVCRGVQNFHQRRGARMKDQRCRRCRTKTLRAAYTMIPPEWQVGYWRYLEGAEAATLGRPRALPPGCEPGVDGDRWYAGYDAAVQGASDAATGAVR